MEINGKRIPDYLYPKGEGANRDEYIYIDFDDVMQAQCENVALGLSTNPEIANFFDKLDTFIDKSEPITTYLNTAPYDLETFMPLLTSHELDDKMRDEMIQYGFSIDTYAGQHISMMAYGIVELSEAEYVKKIVLSFHRPIYQHDIDFIETVFANSINKIQICDETLLEFAKKGHYDNKITTYLTGDTDSILCMATHPDEYDINQAAFLVPANTKNMIIEENEDGSRSFSDRLENYIAQHITEDNFFKYTMYQPNPYLMPETPSYQVTLPMEDEENENGK